MAYSRKYFLQRVRKVNEVYKKWSKIGLSNEKIYKDHIKNQFDISRSTFYSFLTIPYEREIKKIEEIEQTQKSLFD